MIMRMCDDHVSGMVYICT